LTSLSTCAGVRRWQAAGRLDALDVRRNDLADEGCLQLAASPHLLRLRRLSVRHNGIGARGVATLIDAATLPVLESLDLGENKTYFIFRGSQFLGSPGLRRIRSLDLGLTGLGDEGLQVLSGCVHLRARGWRCRTRR
jgi:Ran GTPase-activating protein (RanGAP) involved in mRNA processing and transport